MKEIYDIEEKVTNPNDLILIENILKSTDNRQDAIYDNASFSVLYHLSQQRENIISWYPFKKNATVLELGAGSGVLTEYLADKVHKVIAVESNKQCNKINALRNSENINVDIMDLTEEEFIEIFDQKIDYILMIGYFDLSKNKMQLLHKVKSLLKDDGTLLMANYNKMGIKFLAGANDFYTQELFSGIEGYSNYNTDIMMSKKEVLGFLQKTKWPYVQTYYPYPDHLFTESIYSDEFLPSEGELHNNARNFEANRYQLFDETRAFTSVIKAGLFPEMSNSFLFIASLNENKEECIYTKFSRERNEPLQIQTNIMQFGETKRVLKRATLAQGKVHIEKIYNFYQKLPHDQLEKENIFYCPVEMANNELYFSYIQGKTLESLFAVADNEETMYGLLDIFLKVINTGKIIPFTYTDEFIKIFGSIPNLEGIKAIENPNVDLIFDNIIVNQHINIIDYEWILDIPVPKTFILFRALFHSTTISKMDKEKRNRIFEYCGVDTSMLDTFFNMEISFQNYISRPQCKLSNILNRIGTISVKIYNNDLEHRIRHLTLKGLHNERNYHYEYTFYELNQVMQEVEIDTSIPEYSFIPVNTNCVIDIQVLKGISGSTIEDVEIVSTNARVIKQNAYFFTEIPEIKIKNNNYQKISFQIYYYYIDDNCIQNLSELHEVIDDLIKKNEDLEILKKKIKIQDDDKVGKVLRKLRVIK